MQILCDSFNVWSKKIYSMRLQQKNEDKKRCSNKLIKYLMPLIYSRAVQEPLKLNQYEAFSPEVYGETGFDIIEQMLSRIPLNENEVFLDLGSGKLTHKKLHFYDKIIIIPNYPAFKLTFDQFVIKLYLLG